jgi:hypothetical protein
MAAPTFIAENEVTAWNSTATPRSVTAFSAQTGDVFVVAGLMEADSETLTMAHDGGAGMALTQQMNNPNVTDGARAHIQMWTCIADGTKTVTFTGTRVSGALNWGFTVYQFRGSDGVGNIAVTNNGTGTGAPSVSITRAQANSAIVVAVADWTATTAARTWLTNAGAFTERSTYSDGTIYGAHTGYHADAGATGAVTVGLSSPTTMRYVIGAVEVRGSAAGPITDGWKILLH